MSVQAWRNHFCELDILLFTKMLVCASKTLLIFPSYKQQAKTPASSYQPELQVASKTFVI